MRLSRYAPLEHPLVHQFQRAIESLTAAFSPDSARQYRGTARHFLIYLGEDHPPFLPSCRDVFLRARRGGLRREARTHHKQNADPWT